MVSLCEIISTKGGKWAFVSVTNERGGEEKVCDKRRCRRGIGRVSSSRGRWKNCEGKKLREMIFLILCIRYH